MLHQAVVEALALRLTYFPDPVDGTLLEPLLKRGEELVNSTLTEDDALHWAKGFKFSAAGLQEDTRLLQEFHGNVPAMVRYRLGQLHDSRLSRARQPFHLTTPSGTVCLHWRSRVYRYPSRSNSCPMLNMARGLVFILPKKMVLSVPR